MGLGRRAFALVAAGCAAAQREPLRLGILLALGASAAADSPPKRLVLVGGGDKPPAAIGRLVAWAGGADARVLIVPWASAEPAESAAAFQDDLLVRLARPGQVVDVRGRQVLEGEPPRASAR